MSATDIADGLVAWALAVLPELEGSYDYPAGERDQALPDIAAEVHEEENVAANPGLDDEITSGFEQADVRGYTCAVLLVVDPTDPQAASHQLYDFIDRLAYAIRADQTLGGRVLRCSRNWKASYEPPFVEFEDGSKGRLATLTLSVATPA